MSIERDTWHEWLDIWRELQKEVFSDTQKFELAKDYERFLHDIALSNPKLCREFKINTLRLCADNPENRVKLAFLVSNYTSDVKRE